MRNLFCLILLAIAVGAGCGGPPTPKNIEIDHSKMNHGAMDHSDMQSTAGAAAAPYELQFLDTMIAHHQGAVDMARLVGSRAQHGELKTLAENIIADQQKEIAEMQAIRSKLFGEAAKAVNMEFPGMREGMTGMDMAKLDSLKANAFDLEFIDQMIPHHRGALIMAKDALGKDANSEIKSLAEQIVKAQEAEIKQMSEWKTAWSK